MNTSHSPVNTSSFMSGGMPDFVSGAIQMVLNNKIVIAIAIVGFAILGYLIYDQFINKDAAFNANREHATTDTNSNKTAEMMLFYVDWCPHCKTAKPIWNDLKAEYENKTINGYKVVFTDVNCSEETAEVDKMMNQYNVEGYPTIKLLKDGQIIEYDAKPSKETLTQFLNTVL